MGMRKMVPKLQEESPRALFRAFFCLESLFQDRSRSTPRGSTMKPIRPVAVLGAGTMGSRFACHLANAQVPSLLLDIVLPGEKNRDQAARNGVDAALKSRPGAFFVPEGTRLITTGNFEDDMAKIKDCDWIVEAVSE